MKNLAGSSRALEGRTFVAVAEWHRREGRLMEARELVEEGLGKHPEASSGYVVAARVFRALGEPGRALQAAEAVLRLDPDHREAGSLLADLREERPTSEEAAETGGGEGEEASTSRPDAAKSRRVAEAAIPTRTLAELYLRQGHPEKAAAVYRQMLASDPANARVRERLRTVEALAAEKRSKPQAKSGRGLERDPYDAESAAEDLAAEQDEREGPEASFAWGGDGTYAELRAGRLRERPRETVIVLHGPNLGALGQREPDVYGNYDLPEINRRLARLANKLGVALEVFQSNHEGELVDRIEDARGRADGMVVNPGGLTHTSVVLRDALTGSDLPFVEVHISNTAKRESFRHRSLVSAKAAGVLHGFGAMGYLLGLRGLVQILRERAASRSRPDSSDGHDI